MAVNLFGPVAEAFDEPLTIRLRQLRVRSIDERLASVAELSET